VGEPKLEHVFGIATKVNTASYVDRGGLDNKLAYYLRTERHVAIHGDSKQGKSWLRANLLEDDDTLVVQCQPDSTPESVLREALGQLGVLIELKRTGSTQVEGQVDVQGSGEIGLALIAKAQAEAHIGGGVAKESAVEKVPVGKTLADLSWVAGLLQASGRRVVVEDFHYVSEENRKAFSFILKALGDYGVYMILVGIWPEDHMLTYYNGNLDGRVEDLRLVWEDADLDAVLGKGCEALNISMSDDLRAALVADAHGNVGLVQRLAEQVCLEAGVMERMDTSVEIGINGELAAARATVSDRMKSRYDAFADDFVRGMKRMKEGLAVYKHLLRAFTASSADELTDGIDSSDLLETIQKSNPEPPIRRSDLTQALDRVDRLQVKIGVEPPVLTYNHDRRRLFLADRSFLFYRQHGNPSWPWDKDETLMGLIDAVPAETLFDLDDIALTERGAAEVEEALALENADEESSA
jgi:hypothetical protein